MYRCSCKLVTQRRCPNSFRSFTSNSLRHRAYSTAAAHLRAIIDSRTRDQYLRLLKQLLAPKPGEPESKTNQVDQSWYPLPCRSTPDSLAVPTKIHGDRNEKLLLSTDSSIQSKFQLLCDSLLRKCCIFALVSLAHSEACHTPALCFFLALCSKIMD